MKKIVLSSLMALIASLLLSNIAMGATAIDNMQIQIDKNSATININNNTKPAPTTTKKGDKDDEHDSRDFGQSHKKEKKEHKD